MLSIEYFDQQFLLYIERVRTPFWDWFMVGVTQLGKGEVLLVFASIVGLVLWKNKKTNYITGLIIVVLGGELVGRVIKYVVARPRPEIISQLVEADGFSFPSGHAFMSTSFYGFLIYIAFREIKNRSKRKIAIALLALLIGLVGFSRPYLGVHWLSDVVLSFILGAIWVKISIGLSQRVNNRLIKNV